MWPLLPILIVYFLPVDSLNNGGGWRQQQVVPSSIKEITLNDPWVIEGTIILLSDQDTLPVVDWLWNDSLKLFSAILPSLKTSDTLTIVWRSASITDRSTFFYFQPSDLDSIPENAPDTSFTKPTTRIKSPLDAWSGIRRSGTIVRGIKFGSAGESGSTAGLHLELSGRPSPGIEVEAVVDDRGLGGSTGGSSATLAELDRLYITASTPNLSGTLGDWDLNWSEGEFGRIERRLKGGKFSIFNSRSKLDFAVAGGNNRFATAKIYGYSGNQGPYELPSRFGAVGVTIIAGSEKVWLNNRILRRGLEADYSIDYERGTITFQPSVPIMDGSRIEVEYSPTPESSGDALAGTVNMVPRSAFERARPVLNASAFLIMRSGEHDFKKTPGPRLTPSRKIDPGFDFSYVAPVSKRFGFTISGGSATNFSPEPMTQTVWRGTSAATGGNFPATTPDRPYLTSFVYRDGTKVTTRNSLGATVDLKVSRYDQVSLGYQFSYFHLYGSNQVLTFALNRVLPGEFSVLSTRSAPGQGELQLSNLVRDRHNRTHTPTLVWRHQGPTWKGDLGLGYSTSTNRNRDIDKGLFFSTTGFRRNLTIAFDGMQDVRTVFRTSRI